MKNNSKSSNNVLVFVRNLRSVSVIYHAGKRTFPKGSGRRTKWGPLRR